MFRLPLQRVKYQFVADPPKHMVTLFMIFFTGLDGIGPVELLNEKQPHHIVGHSDIAPQRKQDPGAAFPWQQLVAAGLVPWPDEAHVAAAQTRFSGAVPSVAWFQEKLAVHGFEVPRSGELDDTTRRVIISFQMKYRPASLTSMGYSSTAISPGVSVKFSPLISLSSCDCRVSGSAWM